MAESCLVASCTPAGTSESKPAARDVDHVSVLNIFGCCGFAVNGRPKVNGFGALYSIDYTSQMNIAQASIVTHSARVHDRLVHSLRTIKINFARLIGKSSHDDGSRTFLQCDHPLGIIKFPFVAADELLLKIDNPLACSRHLADERQTYLAVH